MKYKMAAWTAAALSPVVRETRGLTGLRVRFIQNTCDKAHSGHRGINPVAEVIWGIRRNKYVGVNIDAVQGDVCGAIRPGWTAINHASESLVLRGEPRGSGNRVVLRGGIERAC